MIKELFTCKVSGWSTFLFNEEIYEVIQYSYFLPIIISSFASIFIISSIKKTNSNTILFILLLPIIQSCDTKKTNSKVILSTNKINQQLTENSLINLIPKDFEIQYKTEGNINEDDLIDLVLVIAKRKDNTLYERKTLIYLRDVNQKYKLTNTSKQLLPNEYTEDDITNIYYTEDIVIVNGVLQVNLYGTGPSGNLFSHFKYFKENLLLTYIETYNIGAASQQIVKYEPLKGKLTKELINTIGEDLPSELELFSLPKEKLIFNNISPDKVISKVFNKIDSLEIHN